MSAPSRTGRLRRYLVHLFNQLDPGEVVRQKALGKAKWYYNGQWPRGRYSDYRRARSGLPGLRLGLLEICPPALVLLGTLRIGSAARMLSRINLMSGRIPSPSRPPDGGINGDGVMVYPGRDARFPDEDRGLDGPI